MTQKTKKQQNASARASAANTSIPKPFTAAPASLDAFLEVLDDDRVYIVHVDRQPVAFKKKIFNVPIAMNIAIVIGLAARLYVMLPHYLDLIFLSMGYDTPAAIDKAAYSADELWRLTARRAVMVAIDFVLFRFIGMWAWLFFVGDGFSNPDISPARWRYLLGYRSAEIVVRASRSWGADEIWGSLGPGATLDPNAEVVRERLMPALDVAWMRARTGYMMMGRDFELDFGAMLHAHDLVEPQKANVMSDFELCVLVKAKDEASGWCIWRLSEGEGGVPEGAEDDQGSEEPIMIDGLSEEQARRRIEAFRQRLVVLDKESLCYRFIEIVQYESSLPGGFNAERRESTLAKARDAFARADLDFDKFVEDLGGEHMLPGFS